MKNKKVWLYGSVCILEGNPNFRDVRSNSEGETWPAIDLKNGQCVRLRQGKMDDVTVFSDDPAAVAKRWADEGAQRLHVVDLDGAFKGQLMNLKAIEKIVASVKIASGP